MIGLLRIRYLYRNKKLKDYIDLTKMIYRPKQQSLPSKKLIINEFIINRGWFEMSN